MASGIYNAFKQDLMDGSVNLASGGDAIKVILLDNNHSFDATDTVLTDINANELANGNGYTTGGAALAGQNLSGTSTVTWDANNTAWGSATFSAYHAALYDDDNTDSLIASIDFGGVQTVSNGTFTIEWNASGILQLA